MNRKEKNPEEFQEQCEKVCQTYLDAPALAADAENPTITASVDEKTGIQARECATPELPTTPEHCAKREYEYIRHGTLCLLASLCVVTGKIFSWLNPTRKEDDFVSFIWMLLANNPTANWVIVTDNLNTHCSESGARILMLLTVTGGRFSARIPS